MTIEEALNQRLDTLTNQHKTMEIQIVELRGMIQEVKYWIKVLQDSKDETTSS